MSMLFKYLTLRRSVAFMYLNSRLYYDNFDMFVSKTWPWNHKIQASCATVQDVVLRQLSSRLSSRSLKQSPNMM